MSIFDRSDSAAAAAISRTFADPVVWRPQRRRNNPYTSGAWEPDPTRPVRALRGIVNWRPTVIDPNGGASESGGVTAFDCSVDFDAAQFSGDMPVQGDIFEIESVQGNERVQIARPPTDDGSARVFYWCSSLQ